MMPSNTTNPIWLSRSRSSTDSGLRRTASASRNTTCPPSRIGIGSRFRIARLIDRNAMKLRKNPSPTRAAWPATCPMRSGPPRSRGDTRPVTKSRRNVRIKPARSRVSSQPSRAAPAKPGRGSTGYAAATPTMPMVRGWCVTGSRSSCRSGTTVRAMRAPSRSSSTLIAFPGWVRATRANPAHETTVSPSTLRILSPGRMPTLAPALRATTVETTGSRYGLSATTSATRAAVSAAITPMQRRQRAGLRRQLGREHRVHTRGGDIVGLERPGQCEAGVHHERKHDIHRHPGADHDEPGGQGLPVERPGGVDRDRALSALELARDPLVLEARHLDVTAERDPGDPVLRLPPMPADERAPEAEREPQHLDAEGFRGYKVPGLVHEDEDAERDDGGDHGQEHAASRASRRAPASAASTASSVPASPA